MAARVLRVCLLASVVALLCLGASAQSSSSCTTELLTLSPCLNYITGNESTPSSSCCSPLASVLKSEPLCLCLLLNSSSSLARSVNRTRALDLPAACNLQSPPISQCNVTGGPSSSPSVPSGPSGGGSNTGPTTGNGSSAGSSIKICLPLIFSVLMIAVCCLASQNVF